MILSGHGAVGDTGLLSHTLSLLGAREANP